MSEIRGGSSEESNKSTRGFKIQELRKGKYKLIIEGKEDFAGKKAKTIFSIIKSLFSKNKVIINIEGKNSRFKIKDLKKLGFSNTEIKEIEKNKRKFKTVNELRYFLKNKKTLPAPPASPSSIKPTEPFKNKSVLGNVTKLPPHKRPKGKAINKKGEEVKAPSRFFPRKENFKSNSPIEEPPTPIAHQHLPFPSQSLQDPQSSLSTDKSPQSPPPLPSQPPNLPSKPSRFPPPLPPPLPPRPGEITKTKVPDIHKKLALSFLLFHSNLLLPPKNQRLLTPFMY